MVLIGDIERPVISPRALATFRIKKSVQRLIWLNAAVFSTLLIFALEVSK